MIFADELDLGFVAVPGFNLADLVSIGRIDREAFIGYDGDHHEALVENPVHFLVGNFTSFLNHGEDRRADPGTAVYHHL